MTVVGRVSISVEPLIKTSGGNWVCKDKSTFTADDGCEVQTMLHRATNDLVASAGTQGTASIQSCSEPLLLRDCVPINFSSVHHHGVPLRPVWLYEQKSNGYPTHLQSPPD